VQYFNLLLLLLINVTKKRGFFVVYFLFLQLFILSHPCPFKGACNFAKYMVSNDLVWVVYIYIYLQRCEYNLYTADAKFGFKSNHSTETCIYVLKEIIHFYVSRGSAVVTCFMNARKGV
jgi:hypothetical protein